ncbi:hypothetical protein ET445_02010 [Agromyces protaetiae]|uniref:DUF3592 domain-containing protein n=1 Tax=Agromyces protaetiae TaxID=2509455 RepID=A0A4V0YGT1_9MICO|nr:hypothetical protein [Agromyces protaetiae]QAY72291.1 hypothetical protein ET445_02010 [Agromyces protaetiae]
MHPSDVVSGIAEVIGWIALSVGVLCLLIALLIRLVDGRWLPTDAVVTGGGGTPGQLDPDSLPALVRWFAGGEFHERELDEQEFAHVVNRDEQPAFYCERDPGHVRLNERPIGRRILRTLGIVLASIGVVALATGTILELTR